MLGAGKAVLGLDRQLCFRSLKSSGLSGRKQESPEHLWPASFHVCRFPLGFRVTKPVHSSHRVGSLINDFLCLDEKCLSSLADKFVFQGVDAL